MKKETFNAQRRTPNTEVENKTTPNAEGPTLTIGWGLHGFRVNESPTFEYTGRRDRRYDLEDRLLNFAVDVVEFEAAESRKDFLHKLRICLKELRETKRWLRLVSRLKRLGEPANLPACLNEVEELVRISQQASRRRKVTRNYERPL